MENLAGAPHIMARRSGDAAKVPPLRLNRGMAADEAFRAILSACLAQIIAQTGLVRAGHAPEALHHLRVALRRMEVMLAAFGAVFGQAWFAALRRRSKAIAARLAPARDLDVLLDELWPDVMGRFSGGEADFTLLRQAAEAARQRAWEAARACVTSGEFGRLLDDIAALSQSRLPMGRDEKLAKTGRRLLKRAAARVKKRTRRAVSRQEGDLHRLRIALKKLRYLAQMLAPLYHRRRAGHYLAALKRLQEELGAFNDIAHVRATIVEVLRGDDGAALRFSAGLFAGACAAGRGRRAKKALRRHADFCQLRTFWKRHD